MKPDWRPERSISEPPDLYVIEPETVKPREPLLSSFVYYFTGREPVAGKNAKYKDPGEFDARFPVHFRIEAATQAELRAAGQLAGIFRMTIDMQYNPKSGS